MGTNVQPSVESVWPPGASDARPAMEAVATLLPDLEPANGGRSRRAGPRDWAAVDLRPRRDLFNRRRLRERGRSLTRVVTLMGGDALVAALALLTASFLLNGPVPGSAVLPALPLAVLLVVLFQAAGGTYGPGRARIQHDRSIVLAVAAAVAFVWLGRAYDVVTLSVPRAVLLAGLLGGGISGVRVLAEAGVSALRRRGIATSPTLIIGEPATARMIAEHVAERPAGQPRIVGFLAPVCEDTNGGRPHAPAQANGGRSNGGGPPRLGSPEDLGRLVEEHDIRSVIVSPRLGAPELQRVLESCLLHGCRVGVVPDTLNEMPCQVTARDFLGWPLLELQIPRLHTFQTMVKRGLDLVVSATALVFLAPLLLLVAVAVRLESNGPVLFRQRRLGVGGRPFTIFKFRSMRSDAEDVLRQDPELYAEYVKNDFKLPEARDPRVTRLGAFLRRSSLDELPQLLNVLKGDMSLVGPRPIVPEEIGQYGAEAAVFLAVRPGVTGHWQINGRSLVGYPERAKLDIDYIVNWSLWQDLEILVKTVPRVFRSEGAH